MSTYDRLTEVHETAPVVPFDDGSKIIIMSDCHRGDGSWIDNFAHNQNIFGAAMRYYFDNGFTYIENGDGDELWKFKSLADISNVYIEIFRTLHRFYLENRLYLIFGNHDIEKRDSGYVQNNMAVFYDNHTNTYEPLFKDITVHEGLVLKTRRDGTGGVRRPRAPGRSARRSVLENEQVRRAPFLAKDGALRLQGYHQRRQKQR